MKTTAAVLKIFAVVFAAALAAACPTGESHAATPPRNAPIPREANEIRNPRFKNELTVIAPNYDSLSRNEQVRAYIETYRSLNYGAFPYIVSEDLQDAGAGATLSTLPILVPTPHPRWYAAEERGYVQKYIDGYGYKRVDATPPPSFHSYRSEKGYGGRIDVSRRIGDRNSTGTGAPPYAKPYVAPPQKAPKAHAGP